MINSLTRQGAQTLVDHINGYWRKRGFDAKAHVVEHLAGYIPSIRTATLYLIKSDTLNGTPLTRLPTRRVA